MVAHTTRQETSSPNKKVTTVEGDTKKKVRFLAYSYFFDYLCLYKGYYEMENSFTQLCNEIFNQAINDYHVKDNVDTPISNPYDRESIENRLYLKCWIDSVQWHLEDLIRDPHIDPLEALKLKRRIDRSNQDRTDLVEQIDSYFRQKYSEVNVLPDARLNTESPAWAIDRLSILALKIYHMKEQTERTDASNEHISRCKDKLKVLLEQQKDLSTAIDQLLDDIEAGRKYMKVYRQMKMYNDPATNPVLYKNK